MDIWQAIVLGIVQGLTEFLPVSSSAHLIIVPRWLGWPQPGLSFDMALHLGTLVAVLSYFRRDLIGMALALPRGLLAGRPLADPQSRQAVLILVGCLPAGLTGLLVADLIEQRFYSDEGLHLGLLVIGVMMIVLALLLALAERVANHRRQLSELNWRDALIIGLAQALALVPGVSRSGSTITAGLFIGLSRPAAARYSFLLGTPIIFIAALKQTSQFWWAGLAPADQLPFLVGFATSAAVGYVCIALLLRYLQTRSNAVFVVYRIVIGLVLIVSWFVQA